MTSILVTGGAGFIGANFVRYWLAQQPGVPVVVLDALTYAGNLASLAGLESHNDYCFIHGDICDEALVQDLLARHDIGIIVHLAAESHVDRSIAAPDPFIRTNVTGTHVLLQCARRAWQAGGRWRPGARFHHVSTDEVYGSLDTNAPPANEASPYRPRSPYAASKAASDHLVRAYHHTYGLPVTISNCSNNYGPYQFPEKLIPLMLVNALHGEPLPVYGDGDNIRDWLFVTDHCRGLEQAIRRGRPGESYNLGGRSERRNIDVVHDLCALLDRQFARDAQLRARFPDCPASRGEKVADLIEFVADRPGHDWRHGMDCSKAGNELGFRAMQTFDSALARTVEWYLDHVAWWSSIRDGSYRLRAPASPPRGLPAGVAGD